jgi:hypothetical protein
MNVTRKIKRREQKDRYSVSANNHACPTCPKTPFPRRRVDISLARQRSSELKSTIESSKGLSSTSRRYIHGRHNVKRLGTAATIAFHDRGRDTS